MAGTLAWCAVVHRANIHLCCNLVTKLSWNGVRGWKSI
jgi:hypothetical protein